MWQSYLPHFPKNHRFTLGSKIDEIFLNAIEYCFLASYSRETEKLVFLDRCIARVDLLKLLSQLAWEVEALDTKKYESLAESFSAIGKMLGGWRRQTVQKLPSK